MILKREPSRAPNVADESRARVIWTAGGIARRLGCSSDFVRGVLMETPGCPIHRIGGRICAVEDALIAWMRNPSTSQPTPAD